MNEIHKCQFFIIPEKRKLTIFVGFEEICPTIFILFLHQCFEIHIGDHAIIIFNMLLVTNNLDDQFGKMLDLLVNWFGRHEKLYFPPTPFKFELFIQV